LPPSLIERHIPWPRNRTWRPGEPITVTDDGRTVTYRLRGVHRDTDPASQFATVTLEPVRDLAAETDDRLEAAG
jgi:antitoxin (DNA-binding transcriptional repressor) of toxin-antitoxin stability system